MDLGCGNGWLAIGLAKNNLLNVSGVDVSPEELRQAARAFNFEILSLDNYFNKLYTSFTVSFPPDFKWIKIKRK